MTKIIASVLALSFVFVTGVVLGAWHSQPEIKKIASYSEQTKTQRKQISLSPPKTLIKIDEKKSISSKIEPTTENNKFLNKKRTGYTVLLSSFKVEENAENYAKKIAKKGYDAFYFSKEIQGKTWHRVGVGSFSSKSTAESLKKQLEENRLGKGSLISTIPNTKSF